ncbi:MAG: hypothetical protein CR975_06450 [Gammaproteobacteria bacterium]|nr:MAG: hypothetical protein CR975_06450 [Gammaproteobacteria bacterium]
MKNYINSTAKYFFLLVACSIGLSFAAEKNISSKEQVKRQGKAVAAVAAVKAVTELANNEKNNKANLPTLKVGFSGLNDNAQKANVEAFLDIYKERGKVVENQPYARYLAKAGEEQIKQALQPFGYYLADVKMTLEEGAKQWTVSYRIDRGKPVRIRKQQILIKGEGKDNPDFSQLLAGYPLKKGDILDQKKYEDFKGKLTDIATTDGFFDADFARKKIFLSEDYLSADIVLIYDTGKRYQFGQVNLEQDFLDQDVIDRYKTFPEGKVYSSKDIAVLQRDLYNSGYVKVVDMIADPDKTDKTVPVTLKITPKKNKKHTFAIGYGTDSGGRARYDFDWRWVNRRGHQFKSRFFISQKRLNTGVQYKIPGKRPAHDNYKIFANFDRVLDDDDKKSTMWNVGGAYQDVNGNLSREFGVKWQQEDFSIGNDSGNVSLLTPYARFTYRKTDNPIHIKDGIYLDAYMTAAHKNMLSDVSLLQAIGKAKAIKTFADVHRVTLAGGVGKTWTEDFHELPVTYRFFTGGDKTIRGYRFESIGDTDSSDTVIGGDKMYYLSAEYEYFFRDNMAAAAFVDAGDAYSSESAKLKVGAGLGFHYYSPVGPIKVDVAHGFDKPGDKFRLHLSIGPEF